MQSNNLKLLSKFHVARPNCSRVSLKQKTEASHSLVEKWPSTNTETRDVSVDRSNDELDAILLQINLILFLWHKN